ncbi:MAG: hypothetical protein KGL39_14200 [Patescibacteria group bacterium]|nr:hypothetical protein [Patescibacteria group bacterium]
MGALALALGMGASAGGSVLSGVLGSSAATKAAGEQAQSADYAANLQSQDTQQALALQQLEYGNSQAELAPYLNAGYGALSQLEGGMGIPVTTPGLTGISPSTPATLAPQNNAAAQRAQQNGVLLSQLGLSGKETAPTMNLGVSNNNQAIFNQGFGSAADDVAHAVAAGLISKEQGIAAINSLQGQLNMYGGPGQYGKSGATLSNAQSNLQAALQHIQSGQFQYQAPSNASTLSQVYVPSNAAGWEGGSPAQGASLANYAISQALQANGGQAGATPGAAQPTSGLVSSGSPSSDLRTVNLTATNPSAVQSQPPLNTNGALNATSLNEQWATPFQAPTEAQVEQTPGYQFQLDQGLQAIQRSAAAQGNLLTGGTSKDLNNYAQGMASTNYQQAYNNALNQYQQNYNIFQNNQSNQWNKLAALSGIGQTSASQLSNAGQNYANNAANTGMTGAAAVGQQANNAAAAQASGYVGAANAWGGTAQSLGNLPLYALALNNKG